MNLEELLNELNKKTPRDIDVITRAFEFAKKAHEGQTRYSGEPYFTHPLAAARILTKMQMDTPTIAATLLHDVCEDGVATQEEIKKEFGDEISFLVEGVTKLGTIKYKGIERHVESLRKMLLSMAEDIRVIIIKIADRTHNMQTLDHVPEHKRARIALETLEVYAPLADRLGMGKFKGELEDLSFKYLYPEEYKHLKNQMAEERAIKENYLAKVKEKIARELAENNIKIVKIDSRIKHLFSVYQKLLKKDGDLSVIYDIIAVRIIVPTIEDCYTTLGMIHRLWKPVPGKIKDYIALPKPNGYQSIHTTVFCIDGQITEFQIRTEKMHEEAENGITAHWVYSMSGKPHEGAKMDEKVKWISELRDWQKEQVGTQEFLNSLKIDFFKNRIFVFTPQGDVIDLPEGATPIDFAYYIHTDIGSHCIGAKINGKMVSLDYQLKNGEVCDIIVNKKKVPSRNWINMAKTNYAKSKVRSFLKKELDIEMPAAQNPQKTKNIEIKILMSDRVGMLKDILLEFEKAKINLNKVTTDTSNKKVPVAVLNFFSKGGSSADQIAIKLQKIKGVKKVEKTLIKH